MWLRALVLAAVLCAWGCDPDRLDRLADGGRGRVAQALSGEVLELEDGRTVRLAGIDAPGPEAEAALETLAAGREVSLLHGGPLFDAYGGTVAHVRLLRGRRWVQGALIDAGLARVRTSAEDASLAPEMLRREARARKRGRGLWGDPAFRVRLPGETVGEAGFMIVEGRVSGTERWGDSLYLDFGRSREGFSVRIPRRRLSDFEAAGLPAGGMAGRPLRVRGVVRPSRSGPVMLVDHPEQIEPLRLQAGG